MPDMERASISGVKGRGFVEITTDEGVKQYNGLLEADEQELTELAEKGDTLEFEGFAADQMHRYRITLPIEITHFDAPDRAIFKGLTGPKKLEPLDLFEAEERQNQGRGRDPGQGTR